MRTPAALKTPLVIRIVMVRANAARKTGKKSVIAAVAIVPTKPVALKPVVAAQVAAPKDSVRKPVLRAKLSGERVLLENCDAARDLFNQSRYGAMISGGRVQLSLLEAVYLDEKEKVSVVDARGRALTHEQLLARGKRREPTFAVKFAVFRDMRTRGYIVKTALKFGADFRVYDRGVKPGEDHAKWIVYPVHESASQTWYDFAAKNRVAHSTKKRLLIAVVDDEGDVTYYEVSWTRP
jgi:tRNA-intron endonuclease